YALPIFSLVIALTLTPMMCARMLKPESAYEGNRLHRTMGQAIDRVIHGYDRMLTVVLRHQTLTLLVALATFVLTVLLYMWIPKGFFPQQDTGMIQVITEAPQSSSFKMMSERQVQIARAIKADPAVASVSSFIGVDGSNATLNTGRMQVELKPTADRENITEIMQRLQDRASKVQGMKVYLQASQDLTIDARVSRT